MVLTTSQEILLSKMEEFLNGPDKIFLLTGKPGVGKTTMVKEILKDHIKADKNTESYSNSHNMNVAGICLAHQAKNVLGEHIPNVFTFAKAYGMKESFDKFTGERIFVMNKNERGMVVGDAAVPVFVHDEVSQYTQKMIDIMLERTSNFSKIILIGDRAQLPPIDPKNKTRGKDMDSPIFELNIPDHCKHELTERVRQASGNPILELSDIIREEIFGLQRVDVVIDAMRKPQMTNGVGFDYVKYSDVLEHIKGKEILDTRLIAFRNDAINKFNPLIRNYLMDNPENMLVENDVVMMNDSYYSLDDFGHVSYVLYNSELLKMGRVYTTRVKRWAGNKRYDVECYVGEIQGRKEQSFLIPTETGEQVFRNALEELSSRAKGFEIKWKEFWDFKKSFCNWSYGYATTAYKSQGSTYKTVYVDVNDIFTTKPLTKKRQLQTIYTAITRAKNDVYFLKS